jgi:ribosomal protein L29
MEHKKRSVKKMNAEQYKERLEELRKQFVELIMMTQFTGEMVLHTKKGRTKQPFTQKIEKHDAEKLANGFIENVKIYLPLTKN